MASIAYSLLKRFQHRVRLVSSRRAIEPRVIRKVTEQSTQPQHMLPGVVTRIRRLVERREHRHKCPSMEHSTHRDSRLRTQPRYPRGWRSFPSMSQLCPHGPAHETSSNSYKPRNVLGFTMVRSTQEEMGKRTSDRRSLRRAPPWVCMHSP